MTGRDAQLRPEWLTHVRRTSRLAQSSRSSTRSWPNRLRRRMLAEDAAREAHAPLVTTFTSAPLVSRSHARLSRPSPPTLAAAERAPVADRRTLPLRPLSPAGPSRASPPLRQAPSAAGSRSGAPRGLHVGKWHRSGAVVLIALVPLLAFLPPSQAPSVGARADAATTAPQPRNARVAGAAARRLLRGATPARGPDRLDVTPPGADRRPSCGSPLRHVHLARLRRVRADRPKRAPGADRHRHVRRRSPLRPLQRARAGTPATTPARRDVPGHDGASADERARRRCERRRGRAPPSRCSRRVRP